jgi:hypothetical protein
VCVSPSQQVEKFLFIFFLFVLFFLFSKRWSKPLLPLRSDFWVRLSLEEKKYLVNRIIGLRGTWINSFIGLKHHQGILLGRLIGVKDRKKKWVEFQGIRAYRKKF